MSYLNGLVVFPTFFSLSLNFAIRTSLSEPQSAPDLVFADYISPSLKNPKVKFTMLLSTSSLENNSSSFHFSL